MFSRYYIEELKYLREMGREYAETHPGETANALVVPGTDPDVERLLEGFAFLAAHVRERIEDDFPEIVHSLLNLLQPGYIRPVPSATVIAFDPLPGALRDKRILSRGTAIQSRPISGVRCRFATCEDLEVLPLELVDARLERRPDQPATISIHFQLQEGISYDDLGLERLRLFIQESGIAPDLLMQLHDNVQRLELRFDTVGKTSRSSCPLEPGIAFPGLRLVASLFPESSRFSPGSQALLEYFAFPEKLNFVEISGLEQGAGKIQDGRFEIAVILKRNPPENLRVDRRTFRLFAVPAVNLFEHDARQITIHRERSEYRLVPDVADPRLMEVISVLDVSGIVPVTGEERHFAPLYAYGLEPDNWNRHSVYYRTRLRPAGHGTGTETWISFIDAAECHAVPETEVVTARLYCSNRDLATKLKAGDLCERTTSTPSDMSFEQLTRITPTVSPPLDAGGTWRLVNQLAVNLTSFATLENLRTVLKLHDFRSWSDVGAAKALERRLAALVTVATRPDEILYKGTLIRGTGIEISMHDRQLGGMGEAFVLGCVLDQYFSQFSTVNAHTRLKVVGLDSGDEVTWKPRHGTQTLL